MSSKLKQYIIDKKESVVESLLERSKGPHYDEDDIVAYGDRRVLEVLDEIIKICEKRGRF